MTPDVQQINRVAREQRARLEPLYREMGKVLVGQRLLIDRLLVGLLTGGHLLLEGVPGLAKTLAVRTLARGLRLSFSRIQFTPDLLPADVIGTQIYNPRSGDFSIKKGPVFANLVLADEDLAHLAVERLQAGALLAGDAVDLLNVRGHRQAAFRVLARRGKGAPRLNPLSGAGARLTTARDPPGTRDFLGGG
jgi:hypothetical protein